METPPPLPPTKIKDVEIRIPVDGVKKCFFIGVGIVLACLALIFVVCVAGIMLQGVQSAGSAVTGVFLSSMPDGVYQNLYRDRSGVEHPYTAGDSAPPFSVVGEGFYVKRFPETLSTSERWVKSEISQGSKLAKWDATHGVIISNGVISKKTTLGSIPGMGMDYFDAAFGARNSPYYREEHLTISDYRKVYRVLMKYAPPELQERVRAKYDETGLLRPGHSLQEQ